MFRCSGLGLLALLRGIRSIGHTLKSFILRCLLCWPRVLRGLRHIWSLYSGTSPKDGPKKRGQTGSSFFGASGACQRYSAIHASQDFNRASEPHLPLGPGNAEVLHLSPITEQLQSAPHSPASSLAPSLPGSPQRSDRRLSVGSAPSIASLHNADSIHDTRQITIRHLNTPLASTHSRVTSTRFTGVLPSRFRSLSSYQARYRSDRNMRSIMLMHSEQVSRYVNKGDVLPVQSEYRLAPMEVDLPQYSHALCPEGWVPATHPGGALYFYNAERRIFTDVYMYDPDLSAEIHAFAALLDSERTRPFPTNNYDLVLDIITKTQNETIWAYYYIDHHSKTLFWLHYYECGDDLFSEVHGVQDASHVKLRLESLYWVHWSLYPTVPDWRRFPKNAPNELLGTLLSSGIDSLISGVSTSLYTVTQTESIRDFIKEAESLGTENSHVITSVARLLSSYANWRFLNFHGQRTSRQDRYKSIYKGGLRERTRLVRILSPILFFFPDVHLRELEKVWADKISVEVLWKEFTQKLVSEWTEFVLYSTVMLAANVAFLAIPGVIVVPQNTNLQNAWINPSPAQITSSISLVFSLGSIITGLLLIRRYRTMMTKDSKSAWYYLHGMNWPVVGLEPLAIIFSLTYALLMWSAWGFFAALLMFSFQDTSRKIWIPVGTAAGIITVPIVWCVKNIWDPEGREEGLIDWPSLEPQFGNDV